VLLGGLDRLVIVIVASYGVSRLADDETVSFLRGGKGWLNATMAPGPRDSRAERGSTGPVAAGRRGPAAYVLYVYVHPPPLAQSGC
jgi:hypothetical protein